MSFPGSTFKQRFSLLSPSAPPRIFSLRHRQTLSVTGLTAGSRRMMGSMLTGGLEVPAPGRASCAFGSVKWCRCPTCLSCTSWPMHLLVPMKPMSRDPQIDVANSCSYRGCGCGPGLSLRLSPKGPRETMNPADIRPRTQGRTCGIVQTIRERRICLLSVPRFGVLRGSALSEVQIREGQGRRKSRKSIVARQVMQTGKLETGPACKGTKTPKSALR